MIGSQDMAGERHAPTSKTTVLRFVLLAAIGSVASADEIDPLVKASAYGDKTVWSYHGKDPLPWAGFKPKDFGSTKVEFSGQGVRSVGRVPAGGVHPRIFFSPEDLPAIRRRIKEDRGAAEAWKNLLCYANALKLTYDEKADYAQPDWERGNQRTHGRVPVFRVGGYDPKRENYYALLAAGQRPAKTYEKDPPATFFKGASVEALRCLIEDDAAAGKTLAAAVATAVKLEQERRAKDDKPVGPGQPPKPSTPRLACANLGLIYDFLFNFMTPEQRQLVHDELVTISAWSDNYGTFNDAEASRSNWACFNYWVWDLVALHGEPGFNDLKFLGLYRGWRNFYTYSFFDSGAAYEGEGKLLFGLDAAVAMDRIAPEFGLEPLTWHPLPRRYLASFLARSMLPARGSYAVFDILGGMGEGLTTPGDLVVAKYLFPDDKSLDFVYRAHVGDDYRRLPSSLHHIVNEVVTSALFATTFDPALRAEDLGLPLSFVCGQRALAMARSSWDADATFLTMHVRGASGGHPYPDRNGIMLAAEGRPWVTIPRKDIGGWAMNTVLIDGAEQTETTPGRVVDVSDGPLATFMTGDAKYCWDWVWASASKNLAGQPVSRADVAAGTVDTGASWSLVKQSFNDFAWTQTDHELSKRPLATSPSWIAPRGELTPVIRQPNAPVLRAFRTAGLVRGPRPYVLVVDDVQRDPLPTGYDWNLTLPADVVQVSPQAGLGMEGDVILTGTASLDAAGAVKPGQPALLVRVLDCRGERRPIAVAPRENLVLLSLTTRAVAPDFKVLMHAFRMGDPLPTTTWDAGRAAVTVAFPDQTDVLAFSPTPAGRTALSITRDGAAIATLTRPVEPLADPDTDRLTERLRAIPDRLAALEKRGYDPLAQGRFVGGWQFADSAGAAARPLPGSFRGLEPIQPGPLDKPLEGPGGRPALGIGKTALVVPLPAGDPQGKAPFAVAAWVKTKPGAFMGRLFDIEGAFSLGLVQGKLRLTGPSNWLFDNWSAAMLASWTHLALVFDGKQVHTYRNGIPMSSVPVGDRKLRIAGKMRLGGDDAYGDAECAVSGLLFYASALDARAIEDLYLWQKFGPRAP